MDVFSLVAKLTLDSSEYDSSLGKAKDSAGGFGEGLKKSLAVVGTAITAATGAVTAFATSAVKTGSEFDSSMSQIAATLGLTMSDIQNNVNGAGDTFDALRDKAREMGGSTIFSAKEAAEGLNILAMSGYNAEESMAMVEDVLHLAAAGSMDMASAASYVSGAMKGFNDATKDAGYYADLMAKGATLANTSVAELGDAMSSGAAGAAAYGQSADSMTVSLLRLAEQGEVGAAAGTALSAAMKNLFTPTDTAKKALDALGVSAYYTAEEADELNARMEEIGNPFRVAAGEAKEFNSVVDSLADALSGMSAEEANAYKQTIFGIQGLDAYNKMVVTGVEKQEEWADALSWASEGVGEAAKQYETMTGNLEGALKGWGSAVDDLKISISDELTPTLNEFVNFGTTGLQGLTAAFKEGGLSGAMDALGTVLSDGLAMIMEQLPQFVDAGVQLLSSLGEGIIQNLPLMVDAALQIIVSLANGIAENLPELIPTIVDVVLQIVDTLTSPDTITGMIGAALQIILGLAEGLIEAIPQLIEAIPTIIENLINALLDSIPLIIDAGVQLLISLVENLPAIIQGIVKAIPQIITSIVNAVIGNIDKIIEAGVELFIALIENLPTIIVEIVKAVPQIVTAIVKGFEGLFGDIVDVGKRLVEGVWEGISKMATWIKDKVSGFFSGIVDGVKGLLGIQSPSKVFAGIGENMALGLGKGWDSEFDNIKKDIDDSLDFGTKTIDFAASGIGMSSAATVNAVSGAAAQSAQYGGGPITINLMFPDGTQFARYILPSLIDVARSNGTPIANPAI